MTFAGVEHMVGTTSRGSLMTQTEEWPCGQGQSIAVRADSYAAFIEQFIAQHDPTNVSPDGGLPPVGQLDAGPPPVGQVDAGGPPFGQTDAGAPPVGQGDAGHLPGGDSDAGGPGDDDAVLVSAGCTCRASGGAASVSGSALIGLWLLALARARRTRRRGIPGERSAA